MKNFNEATRAEKDDITAGRVEKVLHATHEIFEATGGSTGEILEALMYAAHYVVVSESTTRTDFFETTAMLNRIHAQASEQRQTEKLTAQLAELADYREDTEYDDDFEAIVNEPEDKVDHESELEEVRPEVSE